MEFHCHFYFAATKLDFSTFSLAQLGGDIFDKSFPSLLDDQGGGQGKYKFDWGEKSLIGRLQKKANDGNIVDQVMYTAALSKAKDTYYAKYAKRKQLGENHNNINPKMKYSKMDAITALGNFGNIDGKNKVNCGDFVNNALQSSGITGIKNAGAPSKIIEEGQKLGLGFTNQYLGNFV